MKQEEKEQLLLQDLCARLPYGVKIQGVNPDGEVIVEELFTIGIDGNIFDCNMIKLSKVKPYLFPLLFPLSSMTEEQLRGFIILYNQTSGDNFCDINAAKYIDWLNKNYFDYRGLIEKGLAIDATGLNIY